MNEDRIKGNWKQFTGKIKEQWGHLTDDDLVIVTNGSCVENSRWGDHETAPEFDAEVHPGGTWSLWRSIARQDPSFGRPDVFCTRPDETTWESATLTTSDPEILDAVERICRRDPRGGWWWSARARPVRAWPRRSRPPGARARGWSSRAMATRAPAAGSRWWRRTIPSLTRQAWRQRRECWICWPVWARGILFWR